MIDMVVLDGTRLGNEDTAERDVRVIGHGIRGHSDEFIRKDS